MNRTYTIRYNRTTNHIQGIDPRDNPGAESLNYSLTHCPTMSRNGYRLATGQQHDSLAAALDAIRKHYARKPCRKCIEAAEAALAR